MTVVVKSSFLISSPVCQFLTGARFPTATHIFSVLPVSASSVTLCSEMCIYLGYGAHHFEELVPLSSCTLFFFFTAQLKVSL